ncbi:hypothetical protein R3P38DRAFT_2932575 [Favolaschia claudopus]|uniref:Secreted protein n=1 Tax=Favolaschia claudopus TaxID=2862362 RepID=A0AAW0BSX9_9AGAR
MAAKHTQTLLFTLFAVTPHTTRWRAIRHDADACFCSLEVRSFGKSFGNSKLEFETTGTSFPKLAALLLSQRRGRF